MKIVYGIPSAGECVVWFPNCAEDKDILERARELGALYWGMEDNHGDPDDSRLDVGGILPRGVDDGLSGRQP